MPAATTVGPRTYTRTDSACFEAGLSFSPAGSESSALSAGALAGTVLSVLVLMVLVVVVAKRQHRRRYDADKEAPLAAIEIHRLRTMSPTHRKHSVKLVKVKKAEEDIAREKEELKKKLIEDKVAKAEGAFKQAVAFAKMRYGRNEEITTEKLALVYNMMELSPRPNLEMIAPLMAKTENFLEQAVPDAEGMSDEFVDKVVDFVWEAIPDVMLESIIDAYAHMKKQLDAYFQQVKEKRDKQRDAAAAASAALADAGGDLVALPEGDGAEEEEEDIYEIPQALMNVMMGDGDAEGGDDDPDYAEIGDDMVGQEELYCEPSEFRPLNEEADYEDMLEQIEEDVYVEAVPLAGDGAPLPYDLGDTYNNMHEGIYNSPVDSPDSAGSRAADHDENYDNKGAVHELDDYGIGDEDDPYTFAGVISPNNELPSDSDDDDDGEVYSVANEQQSGLVPAPSDGDDYGLFTTLRRKPTDVAAGEDEEDTYSNTQHTLRRQARESDYGNAASLAARDVLSPEDSDLYENSERVIRTLHRPPRRTTEYDYQDAVPPPRSTIDSTYDGAALDGYGHVDGEHDADESDDEGTYGCSAAEAAGLGGSFTGANSMFLKAAAGAAAAEGGDNTGAGTRPASVASDAMEEDMSPRIVSSEYIDANFASLPRGTANDIESVHYTDANFSPNTDTGVYGDASGADGALLGHGGTAFMEEDMHARIVYMSDGTLQRVGGGAGGDDVDPYMDIDASTTPQPDRADAPKIASPPITAPAVAARAAPRRRSEATYAVVQRSTAGLAPDAHGSPSPPAGFRPPLATPTQSLSRSQSARGTPDSPSAGSQRASKKTTRVAPPTVLLDVLKRTALAQGGAEATESFPEPAVLASPKAIGTGDTDGSTEDVADSPPKSSLQRRSSVV
eukprot:m.1630694 g.1630694  ORF g.1630694 m.1630694 type:complete len:900 (+) comp25399_c0_seq4:1-2700(+)